MYSSIILFATAIASVSGLPAPQSGTGTVPLGEQCSTSADCANGANCYATNSMLITRCGNFQASCSTDSQCAFNTCENGLCNGFIAPSSTSTSSAAQSTSTSTTVYLPLGADCNPNSTPCANGSQCWASNSMLQPRCGNFNAACTSDSQCAYNLCNTDSGLCSGFKPSSSAVVSSTISAAQSTSTSTTVYLPLGADCNPDSTPCANGSQCWASNSMLQPRCGNFNAACTSDSQCAFNICNTDTGLCSGFKQTSTVVAACAAPTAN